MDKQPLQEGVIYTPSLLYDICLQQLNGQSDFGRPVTVQGKVGNIRRYERSASAELTGMGAMSVGLYFSADRDSWNVLDLLVDGMTVKVTGRLFWSHRKKDHTVVLSLAPSSIKATEEDRIVSDEIRFVSLLRQKRTTGYKDLKPVIIEKIQAGEKPRIALVCPKSGTAETDIKAGLGDSLLKYEFRPIINCDFTSPGDIAAGVREADRTEADIIALSRGGGTALEVLDDIQILEAVADTVKPVIVALGHEKDVMKAGPLADLECSVPYALGRKLADLTEDEPVFPEEKEKIQQLEVQLKKAEQVIKVLKQSKNEEQSIRNGMYGKQPYTGYKRNSGENNEPSYYGLPGTANKVVRTIIYILTVIGLITVGNWFI